MSVEVKQALERGFDISLATKEIRQLTLSKLNAIATGQGSEQKDETTSMTEQTTTGMADLKDDDILATKVIVQLNDSTKAVEPIYIVHPIEGKKQKFWNKKSKNKYSVTCWYTCICL